MPAARNPLWLVHAQHCLGPLHCWQCLPVHSCQAHRILNTLGVESWSVINDQDAVARGGKFMGLFKRAGDRIFLNQKGDMLVCPIFLEAALWRKLGNTSVRHHMMAAYLKVRVGQHPYDICK